MRLCRFSLDELVLTGFYSDDHVIPIDQASEAYCEDLGVELLLPTTEDLLDLLPPEGYSSHAVVELAKWVDGLDADTRAALSLPIESVQVLIPIGHPKKIFLLAGNYARHVAEGGERVVSRRETFPHVFLKPPTTTLTHPGDPIVIPAMSPDHIDWECELGVVIGRACRDVDEEEALDYVAGYTIVNDVSDRRFALPDAIRTRERDPFFRWLMGKWHDTFCPVGPCVLSADAVADPQALAIQLTVNGEVKQDATTAEMIFPVAAIVSFLSRFVTLEPGDIIATGTPSGVGAASDTYLKPGDVVRAAILGIGELENPVESES